MQKNIETASLMQAGVHFGHKTAKWNPKMKKYIYGVKSGIHIFDLEKTAESLQNAFEMIVETVAKGGVVLFVGNKKQARKIVERYATEADCPYVSRGWIGGTITNWPEINRLIKKLDELEAKAQKEDYAQKYTKRERQLFQEEIDKLILRVGGIRNMKKIADCIFITSIREEKTAVREARAKKIPIVGIVDSDADPELADWPIPGNDDAVKSLETITSLVADAVKKGRKEAEKRKIEEQSKNEKITKLEK